MDIIVLWEFIWHQLQVIIKADMKKISKKFDIFIFLFYIIVVKGGSVYNETALALSDAQHNWIRYLACEVTWDQLEDNYLRWNQIGGSLVQKSRMDIGQRLVCVRRKTKIYQTIKGLIILFIKLQFSIRCNQAFKLLRTTTFKYLPQPQPQFPTTS